MQALPLKRPAKLGDPFDNLKTLPADIARQFEEQVRHCSSMGSALTASICRSIADRGLPEGRVHDRIANWVRTGTLAGDVLQLRFAAALHRLVLDQRDHDLAAQYPPHPLDEHALFAAVCGAVVRHAAFIDNYMDSPPQTNEVGRSAILLPAILGLAQRHGLPFQLYELGASAGLNQGLAHFSYDYADWRWGNTNAPVQLNCEWRGNPPDKKSGSIEIEMAQGCDIAPVKIDTEEERQRLTSYVWPDQSERLERLKGALAIAQTNPQQVTKAGASDWLAEVLEAPQPGKHALIMHTIMWQYMPDEEQQSCAKIIEAFGNKASMDAPVSWLRFEIDGKSPGGLLTLTHWCGEAQDGRAKDLARADYHGKWIDWI